MKLDQEMLDKYEKFSIHNAIAQMDDMGWCPLVGCGALANLEKENNYGTCQHCDYTFCLDCKNRYHPFKRCALNRVDLLMEATEEFDEMKQNNAKAANDLMNLFFRWCAKECPNHKCRAKI